MKHHSAPQFRSGARSLLWDATAMLICLFTAAVAQDASASNMGPRKDPTGVTWGELQLLPEYCVDANGIVWGDASFNPSPRAGRWIALMGEDFWHIHHYCYGLAKLRRAEQETNPTKRRFMLGTVLGEYVYMIKNTSPSLIVMPEIMVRKGDVHLQLGEVGEALLAYQTAMDLKPDYWPSYSRAATMFSNAKNKKRALEFLERGLAAVPDSKELQQQYAAAGGDLKKLPTKQAAVRTEMPPPLPTSGASAASVDPPATPAPSPQPRQTPN